MIFGNVIPIWSIRKDLNPQPKSELGAFIICYPCDHGWPDAAPWLICLIFWCLSFYFISYYFAGLHLVKQLPLVANFMHFYFQVQDYIFTESNKLLKSIQLMLNALNMLRKGYITAKLNTLVPHKREGSKVIYLLLYTGR